MLKYDKRPIVSILSARDCGREGLDESDRGILSRLALEYCSDVVWREVTWDYNVLPQRGSAINCMWWCVGMRAEGYDVSSTRVREDRSSSGTSRSAVKGSSNLTVIANDEEAEVTAAGSALVKRGRPRTTLESPQYKENS
ncbi:hypothetical protein Tco_1351999 [Tanacetum coccineum]